MGKKRKAAEPAQAEIWDDSALVDSWNEAYEEYKFYHSIHARGEKVKDVLAAYERGEDEANLAGIDGNANHDDADMRGGNDASAVAVTRENQMPASEDGEIDEDVVADTATAEMKTGSGWTEYQAEAAAAGARGKPNSAAVVDSTGSEKAAASASSAQPLAAPATAAASIPSNIENMPGVLFASGPQDPALKNLMMSWYWAGYYNGLYEGQQQQRQQEEQ